MGLASGISGRTKGWRIKCLGTRTSGS
jgi:hypothetical protein